MWRLDGMSRPMGSHPPNSIADGSQVCLTRTSQQKTWLPRARTAICLMWHIRRGVTPKSSALGVPLQVVQINTTLGMRPTPPLGQSIARRCLDLAPEKACNPPKG